ncbi:hypothetical protein V2J09_006047 [Rumex salicifolius]
MTYPGMSGPMVMVGDMIFMMSASLRISYCRSQSSKFGIPRLAIILVESQKTQAGGRWKIGLSYRLPVGLDGME